MCGLCWSFPSISLFLIPQQATGNLKAIKNMLKCLVWGHHNVLPGNFFIRTELLSSLLLHFLNQQAPVSTSLPVYQPLALQSIQPWNYGDQIFHPRFVFDVYPVGGKLHLSMACSVYRVNVLNDKNAADKKRWWNATGGLEVVSTSESEHEVSFYKLFVITFKIKRMQF